MKFNDKKDILILNGNELLIRTLMWINRCFNANYFNTMCTVKLNYMSGSNWNFKCTGLCPVVWKMHYIVKTMRQLCKTFWYCIMGWTVWLLWNLWKQQGSVLFLPCFDNGMSTTHKVYGKLKFWKSSLGYCHFYLWRSCIRFAATLTVAFIK